ncbi:MAG TPA: hypothetical protein VES42_26325 [Pilimelia sp.]|nr:hypothetical protein [Pilimelia sp.]
MRSDDEFTSHISERLHAETAELNPSPSLLRSVRRRHLFRAVAVRGTLAVLLVTGAAVGIAAVSDTGRPVLEATLPAPQPLVPVSQQTVAALARAQDHVVRSTGKGMEILYDPVTGRDRATYTAGGARTEIATSGRPSARPTVTVVDHRRRSWWTYRLDPPPGLSTEAVDRNDAVWDAAQIREALATGVMREAGPEVVDGRETMRLVVSGLPRGEMTLWVDTATYLPHRLAVGTSAVTYRWLPRTAATLALLDLAAPAGYRHLASPPSQPARPGGGVG